MSLITVRAEIAKALRKSLVGTDVLEHGGTFDLGELKRVATRMPAVVIVCLGVTDFERQAGAVIANSIFAAFVVAANTLKAQRDVAALALVEEIAVELPFQTWDHKAAKAPTGVVATNMYSAALDKEGVTIWAIRWNQQVQLEHRTPAEYDALLSVYTTMTAADDADNTLAEGKVTLAGPA